VPERASQAIEVSDSWLIDIALDHLSLERAPPTRGVDQRPARQEAITQRPTARLTCGSTLKVEAAAAEAH